VWEQLWLSYKPFMGAGLACLTPSKPRKASEELFAPFCHQLFSLACWIPFSLVSTTPFSPSVIVSKELYL